MFVNEGVQEWVVMGWKLKQEADVSFGAEFEGGDVFR